MAKSQNAMDVFRREQKKKELKKNQQQRQKDKQAKLGELDVDEIQDRLKKLDRQIQQNPADGPTRKRKQELEDTLKAVLKKQKTEEEEKQQTQKGTETTASKAPMTLSDMDAANRERFQNPENSIYYHSVLNPFGAPPPGRPQMYRVPPPAKARLVPPSAPLAPPSRHTHVQPTGGQHQQHHRRSAAPHHSSRQAPVPGPVKHQRPGKRPPLPPTPPPPGTIQVPPRPPLPASGGVPSSSARPPPPPRNARVSEPVAAPLPSPSEPPSIPREKPLQPQPIAAALRPDEDQEAEVASQPPVVIPEHDDADRAERHAQLRALMPTTLRVQRQRQPSARPTKTPPAAPGPPQSKQGYAMVAPGPALQPLLTSQSKPVVGLPPSSTPSSASVSNEFDAFMEEMKGLGAL